MAKTDVSMEVDNMLGVSWSVASEYMPRMLMMAMLRRSRLSRRFRECFL